MAGVLDLTTRAVRAIGLREHDFKYPSLHGDSLRTPREPSPSVFAPPRDSSSDERSDGQLVPDDGASDDSEFGRGEKKGKPNRGGVPRRRTDSSSAHRKEGRKRELSIEPSNIPTGSFTSGKGPGSRNGSQSSQKRNNPDLDEGDLPLSFSQHQKKKPRQSYGHGSMNKQRSTDGLVTKPGNHMKMPPKDAMLARVDRCSRKPEDLRIPDRIEATSAQTSQRDQRASQRSVKSTQESSQSAPKSFKQPLRPSPRKVLESRNGLVICEASDPLRAPRFSVPDKRIHSLSEDNASKPSEVRSAIKTATDKLGISDMHINVPPSVTLDSSAPPTSLDVASTVSSPLSSLDDSPLGFSQETFPVITSEDLPIHTAESPPAVCPMCKQPVDQSYLEAFTKVGTRMSLRQQSQFCKAHKERSAESEWAERGYPSIDWQQLDNRITGFHTSVDDILSRRNFSFYRNAFEDFLKGGKNKTIQESLMADEIEGTSPGYYGGRGAKVMSDNIMSRFASKLRRLAASDKLISSGGVSRYVQAVLVPELATLLIKDDMKVDEERAREVLNDSVDIGNLLNEEEDEIITDPPPKDSEVVDMM